MKCCITGENFIRLLEVSIKLFKFEIQKCGQILCAHKPYFLMPGRIYCAINVKTWAPCDTCNFVRSLVTETGGQAVKIRPSSPSVA